MQLTDFITDMISHYGENSKGRVKEIARYLMHNRDIDIQKLYQKIIDNHKFCPTLSEVKDYGVIREKRKFEEPVTPEKWLSVTKGQIKEFTDAMNHRNGYGPGKKKRLPWHEMNSNLIFVKWYERLNQRRSKIA